MLDDAIDNYEGAVPIGSADWNRPISLEEIPTEPNDDNASLRNPRAEYQLTERTKKSGVISAI